MQTGINLFTVRDLAGTYSLPEVLTLCATAGYDGVEFLHLFPEADLAALQDTLAETGLAVPSAHLGPFVSLDEKSSELERLIDSYAAVDCGALAVSVGERTRFETLPRIVETAHELESLADRAAEHGIDLLYHNHHWEFHPLEGRERPAFDYLLESLDTVGIEFDVGWAAAGGANPVARIEELSDRIEILHVKDVVVDENCSVEVGTGDVDLAACVKTARENGVDWFVYEHDEPNDPRQSLETGIEYLDTLG